MYGLWLHEQNANEIQRDEEEADGWDHVMRESANEKCNLSAR